MFLHSRADCKQGVDADYYGFRDDEDGVLAPLEAEAEREGTHSPLSLCVDVDGSSRCAAVKAADIEWLKTHASELGGKGAAAALRELGDEEAAARVEVRLRPIR